MKVAYFGFDLFYDCLEQIKKNGHDIIKIFTCKVDGVYEFSDKVHLFASENNIKITDEKVTENDIEQLILNGCELLFSAGYYFKIPVRTEILGLNIHPALLPIGRGPWPQPLTILKGLSKSGITLHKLSDKFDEGDIVLQQKFDVDAKENLETLTKKNAYYAKRITEKLFSDFDNIISNSFSQSKGEYWPEPAKFDMCFSSSDDAEKIDTVLRAFYGFGCTFEASDTSIRIKKGLFLKETDDKYMGYDFYHVKDGVVVVLEYA